MFNKWAFLACLIAAVMLGGCTRCSDQPAVETASPAKGQSALPAAQEEPTDALEAAILTDAQLAAAEETKKMADQNYREQVGSFDGATYVKPVLDRLSVEPILKRWEVLKPERDLLIAAFEKRAQEIRQAIRVRESYLDPEAPLTLFDKLHTLHISTLKNGDVLLAHNVLLDIMRLSYNLCGDHYRLKRVFELPDRDFILSETACQDGVMVCLYITGKARCEEPFKTITAASYQDPARTMDLYEAVLTQIKAEAATQPDKAQK
jgi:hypothetical protein